MKISIKRFSILLFLSLLLMGMDSQNWLYWPKKQFEKIFNPIQKRIYSTTQNLNSWKDVWGISQKRQLILLENEKETLKEKVALMEKEITDLKNINQDQNYLLQVPTSPKWNFLPAEVLRFDGSSILINKGRENNIKKGMIVTRGKKDINKAVLIGKITQVNPISAIVTLPSSTQTQIPVKFLEGGEGLVRGKINGEVELFNVLQEVEINQNQLVVTSGKNEKYPEGLVIGRIENIIKEESEVYQRAIIDPICKYSELENVFVVMVDQFKE